MAVLRNENFGQYARSAESYTFKYLRSTVVFVNISGEYQVRMMVKQEKNYYIGIPEPYS